MKFHQTLFGFLLCCSCSASEGPAPQQAPPVVVPLIEMVDEPIPASAPAVRPAAVVELGSVGPLRDHPAVVAQAHHLARDSWTVRVGLRRADAFFPMIEGQLVVYGLPRELAFVPMVESVFQPEAQGRRALGLLAIYGGDRACVRPSSRRIPR